MILRRPQGERLRMRLPYAEDNRGWLREGRRSKPEWLAAYQCWELPKAWFNGLVDSSLLRFGAVYVIQPYREMEKCAPACLNAKGHECECSCMGQNHGQGSDGTWFEVSETFAFRWGPQHLACRLLRRLALP